MKLAKLLCGVALGGLLASNAMAADLLYSSPAPQAVYGGGPYVGAKIGGNWMDDFTSNLDAGGAVATLDVISLDTGFTGSIVAGYGFGTHWGALSPRFEVEAGYLSNDVSTVQNDSAGVPGASDGSISAFYWFANLLLDVPMNGWGFTPVFGGGVGFANVDVNADINTGFAGGSGTISQDAVFAWNLTAGLSYDISRNVTFDVMYRFMQFNGVNTATLLGGGIIASDDVNNNQVTAGVRVHL